MNDHEFENQFDEPVGADAPVAGTESGSTTERDETKTADATTFFSSAADLEALAEIPCDAVEPALKRLGPPPFARKGFPIMGLMATIYDHVAERVGGKE